MPAASTIQTLTQLSYLIAAALFILGLKRMSSPVTAVSGVRWAGVGMVLATVVTLAFMQASSLNLMLVIAAIAIGSIVAWVSGKRVAMTDMPQMIALYNGMGGGAAAAIAAVELYSGNEHNPVHLVMAAVGGFIGTVSFSGSLIAFAKLQGLITKSVRFGGQKFVNLAILLITLGFGFMVVSGMGTESGLPLVSLFFVFALPLFCAAALAFCANGQVPRSTITTAPLTGRLSKSAGLQPGLPSTGNATSGPVTPTGGVPRLYSSARASTFLSATVTDPGSEWNTCASNCIVCTSKPLSRNFPTT